MKKRKSHIMSPAGTALVLLLGILLAVIRLYIFKTYYCEQSKCDAQHCYDQILEFCHNINTNDINKEEDSCNDESDHFFISKAKQ